MPANSGALTGTIAHKHSALSADGGFLDDGVTGVTGTANGSLIYFDGSSVAQNLSIGSNTEVLTISGGLPSWQSAGGGGTIAYQKVAENELGVAGTSIDVPFAQIDMVDIAELVVFANLQIGVAGRSANMRVNSVTSSDYSLTGYTIGTGPSIAATSNSGTSWHLELSGSASQYQQMVAHLIVNHSGDIQAIIQYAADNYPSSYTAKLNTSTTFFDNIEIINDPSGGGSFAVGSNVTVFKVLR